MQEEKIERSLGSFYYAVGKYFEGVMLIKYILCVLCFI